MKAVLLAAAALAGAMLTPAAHAQVTCNDLARLLTEAESDFGGIMGDDIGNDWDETDLVLPGASDCALYMDMDSRYRCTWRFSDEVTATRFVNAQTAEFRSCLTKDWAEEKIEGADTDEWRIIAGTSFELTRDDEEFGFVVRADASLSDKSVYEVELALRYFWY